MPFFFEAGDYLSFLRAYWRRWLHTPLTEKELAAVRRSVTTGRLYGEDSWVEATADRLGFELSPRPRGRLRKMEK